MKKETKICFLIDFAFCCSILTCIFVIFNILPLFWPFWLAFFLAAIFSKLSASVKSRLKIKSKWATVISAGFFYLFSAIAIWTVITAIAGNILEIAKGLPDLFSKAVIPITDKIWSFSYSFIANVSPSTAISATRINEIIKNSLSEIIPKISQILINTVGDFFKNLPVIIVGFIFTIVSSFYIAVDSKSIVIFFKSLIPQKFHFFFIQTKMFFTKCLSKILKAYLMLMMITFAELSVGFLILGIEGSFKLAFIIALLDILPLLGTGGVLIPWGIFSLFADKIYLGAGLLILYAIVAVVRNILEPQLIGKELGLHPLVSLIAVFAGLRLMGLKGVIIFPIAFLAVKYLFGENPQRTEKNP